MLIIIGMKLAVGVLGSSLHVGTAACVTSVTLAPYHALGAVPGTFHGLTHFTAIATFRDMCYCYLHFIDKGSEVQELK